MAARTADAAAAREANEADKRAKLVESELRKLQDEADALRQVSMGTVSVGVVPGFLQSQVLTD